MFKNYGRVEMRRIHLLIALDGDQRRPTLVAIHRLSRSSSGYHRPQSG